GVEPRSHGRPLHGARRVAPGGPGSLDRPMLIDSHVNLHAPQFDEDREAVIARALAGGVRLMVNICDRVSNYPAVRLVAQHPDIWCTVGTHPHEAKEDPELSSARLIE